VAFERTELVDEAVGYLRESVCVNLVGLRHSGRSYIARLVADRLRDAGCTVVSVAGIASLADRPLAVLALAGINVSSGGATASISNTVAGLGKLLSAPNSVLIIDDADELDPVSCGALAAAHSRQPFPVFMVTRRARRLHPAVRELSVQFQPGVRLELGPMGYDQLNRVIHAMLSGPVDSDAIARIATLSGGLPGLAAAVVQIGRRTGAIVADGALWRVSGDLRDERLAEAVEPLLADLSDEELDTLTTLSFAGAIPVAQARELVASQALAAVGDLGLIQVAQAPVGPFVGVFPPLLADHLRSAAASQLDVLEAADRSERVEQHADPGAVILPSRLALTASRAGILAARIAEHWQTEANALELAWRADPTPRNAVPLIFALNSASAEPAALAAVIAGTSVEGAEPVWAARFAGWCAAYQALLSDDFDGGCALLESQRVALPSQKAHLSAVEAMLRLVVGPLPSEELLAPVPHQDEQGAEALAAARLSALIAAGRTADALAALPDVAPTFPFYLEIYRICAGLAHVLHGDLDEGVEWALSAMAEAEAQLSLGELMAHAYVAALGLTFAGRLDELEALLAPLLTLRGATVLYEQYQVGLLGLASITAGWRGQRDYAWSLAVQAEAIGRRLGPFPGMTHGVTPILGMAPDGQEAIGKRLWKAVDDCQAQGWITDAVTLGITAVEARPDAAHAAIIAEGARLSQSPLLTAIGEYVGAAGAGDPEALAQCITALRELGMRLHVVKAMVTRALALRARGDIRASVRQAEEAWDASQKVSQNSRGLFLRLGQAVGLSAREQEIAGMLAEGMNAQGIAAALNLSVRTVENYLFAAYRKLGAEGRDDLVRAVSTWAALE
jgi:DNA-binding CsgD family transcriptional regulator